MTRFMTYINWADHLPQSPEKDFLMFINDESPLANKLREKWLYQLAQLKDWQQFTLHYKSSTQDINLQCFYHFAQYQLGEIESAVRAATPLWLTGFSQPSGCNQLFALMLKNNNLNEASITSRIILALEYYNLPLARYLLKQYQNPLLKEEQTLIKIYQNPTHIESLPLSNQLYNHFYLFGLKRLVSLNKTDKAILLWDHALKKRQFNEAQQQAFYAHVALYKAMRNDVDAPLWFRKVKPAFYNDLLLDWQVRMAIKNNQWEQVENLIQYFQDKDNPCWQYWFARAHEHLGHTDKALSIYQTLSTYRHYYGFLSSLRLNKPFSFQHEPSTKFNILKPYQPFIDQIKSLYQQKQTLKASRLLNDFISELPKEDKSALLSWVAHELKWYGKSVALSQTDELINQLSLRFPIVYSNTINNYAKLYQLPTAFIYAIIRQESAFREDAVSSAGARGLMQVMPITAQNISKKLKITYHDKAQLFLSQPNLNLGIAYLNHLGKRFNHHLLLMAAAYNAGPRQVLYWLKNHPPKEIDIWIETLPWGETRHYLKNVIAFYAVYQYRMQQKPDVSEFFKPL